MSKFICHHCNAEIVVTPTSKTVKGCEHFPSDGVKVAENKSEVSKGYVFDHKLGHLRLA